MVRMSIPLGAYRPGYINESYVRGSGRCPLVVCYHQSATVVKKGNAATMCVQGELAPPTDSSRSSSWDEMWEAALSAAENIGLLPGMPSVARASATNGGGYMDLDREGAEAVWNKGKGEED